MMRKTTAKLLTLTLLLSATTILAQRPARPAPGGFGGAGSTIPADGQNRPGQGPGGPWGSGQNRIEFLGTVLSLTDEQKTQAKAIFDAAQTAGTSLRETQGLQRTALNDAAKSNAADGAIDDLAATLGTTSGQLAAIQTKAFAKFYALLTTEQRTKLDELQAKGRGMRGPGAEPPAGLGF
jgi:Spy/CpxP family protein refolding chaperone